MAVYVDVLRTYPTAAIAPAARRHGQRWCHMIADTRDELHALAERIGLKRSWFQGDHYDLVPTKRLAAVRAGAISLETREFIEELRSFRQAISSSATADVAPSSARRVRPLPSSVTSATRQLALGTPGRSL